MAFNMYEESPLFTKLRHHDCLSKSGRLLKEPVVLCIRNSNVIYSFDMLCVSKVLYRGNESFGARVESMLWHALVVGSAPCFGFEAFGRCVASCFAVGDEPFVSHQHVESTFEQDGCTEVDASLLTHGPFPLQNPIKHPIHLSLIMHPIPAHERH